MTQEKTSLIKQYAETITICMTIITSLLTSTFWINGKFNEVDKKFYEMHEQITVIKTVLIMKNILPTELSTHENSKP